MSYLIIANGNVLTVQEGNFPQLSIGLDVEKPSAPGVGAMHIATDSNKTYMCFVPGLWALTNSPCIEKYENHTGGNDAVANSYVVGLGASAAVAPHMHHLGAGDGVGNLGSWMFEIPVNPATQYFKFSAKLGPITNGVGGDRYTQIGLLDNYTSFTGPDPSGCYFTSWPGNDWQCVTANNAIGMQQTLISDLVEGDDVVILGQKTRILFFVNGILVANHENNIVPAAIYPTAICQVADSSSTAQRLQRIDYMAIEVMK